MIKAMRRLPTVLAAVAVLYSLLTAGALAAANDVEDARNVVAAFATHWNHHDLDAFGKLFAPDAEFVNVAGQLWTGRQSIQNAPVNAFGYLRLIFTVDDIDETLERLGSLVRRTPAGQVSGAVRIFPPQGVSLPYKGCPFVPVSSPMRTDKRMEVISEAAGLLCAGRLLCGKSNG
jgi:hypothetical protein